MHVEFLTGSSGSGKSKRLYDILLDMSQENPDKKIFLVVPEQFTMQAQRNIVENSPGHGTFNIDIVSFNRLAYRIFEELGIELPTAIDDTGKNLILRKIIRNLIALPNIWGALFWYIYCIGAGRFFVRSKMF